MNVFLYSVAIAMLCIIQKLFQIELKRKIVIYQHGINIIVKILIMKKCHVLNVEMIFGLKIINYFVKIVNLK